MSSLGLAHSLCAQAYPTVKYGEFVVQYALLWLPEYFSLQYDPNNRFLREMESIAREVRKLSIDETRIPKGDFNENHYSWKRNTLVQFLPESSGRFVIKGTPTMRVAVTGDAVDSKIIFNRDKISDRKQFTYEDAIVFWVHEIGHKYIARHKLWGEKKREAQAKIDDLASYMGKRFARFAVVESGPLIAFNGAPYGHWRHDSSLIYGLMHSREPNKLFVIDGDQLTDMTPVWDREMDRWTLSHYRNSWQMRRHIREIQIWGSNPGEIRARIRFYVNRRTLHEMKSYLGTDMGVHFPHVADILIRDGTVRVWNSREDRPDMKRAEDAEIELPYFKVDSDGYFVAELHMNLTTTHNHHAVVYPVNENAKLMFVVNGESKEVEVTTYANLNDKAWWKMPHELYKTPMFKRARLEGKMPAGWENGFEVVGMIDNFFALGYQNGSEPMFVALKSPLRGSVCENEIRRDPNLTLTPYIPGYELPGRKRRGAR